MNYFTILLFNIIEVTSIINPANTDDLVFSPVFGNIAPCFLLRSISLFSSRNPGLLGLVESAGLDGLTNLLISNSGFSTVGASFGVPYVNFSNSYCFKIAVYLSYFALASALAAVKFSCVDFNSSFNNASSFFAFFNIGNEEITIKKGDAIGQGIFQKYLIVFATYLLSI